jgi:hypothetical protein
MGGRPAADRTGRGGPFTAGGLRHRRAGLAYRLFLKDAAGAWRPPKRVDARVNHLTASERERFDVRAALMHSSESAFAEAVQRRDLAERLSMTPVRRAMRKLKDGLRWLVLRLRPPQPLSSRSGRRQQLTK